MRSDDEIQRLCNEATPGPWESCDDSGDWFTDPPATGSYLVNDGRSWEQKKADACFIAAARELVPELLARAQRAEAERDDLQRERDAQVDFTGDDWLRDQHARYHDEPGNMLGRDDCGWERCEFWDAAVWVLNAPGERDRLAAELAEARAENERHGECVGCNYNDGPDEFCPRHGRTYDELLAITDRIAAEREALTARVRAVEALHREITVTTGVCIATGRPSKSFTKQTCDYCSRTHVGGSEAVTWPCATIRALAAGTPDQPERGRVQDYPMSVVEFAAGDVPETER